MQYNGHIVIRITIHISYTKKRNKFVNAKFNHDDDNFETNKIMNKFTILYQKNYLG